MEHVQYYVPTEESRLLQEASALDPLGINELMPGVPDAIDGGNVRYLSVPLAKLAEMALGSSIDSLSAAELVAMTRDGDYALMVAMSAMEKRGGWQRNVFGRFKDSEPALIALARQQDQLTDRANINAYLAQAPGARSFTGLVSEAHFHLSIEEAYFASDYALELLSGANFAENDFDDIVSRLSGVGTALEVLLFSNQNVEENVGQEDFAFSIQPRFQKLHFNAGTVQKLLGRDYYVNPQGATQLPLRLVEDMLRGKELGAEHKEYWQLHEGAYPHMTAQQRASHTAFSERNLMSYQEFLFGDNNHFSTDELTLLRGLLDDALNLFDNWRARHLYIASQSFKLRPEDAIGSSEGSPPWLAAIHKAARLASERRKLPLVAVDVVSPLDLSTGKSTQAKLTFHNLSGIIKEKTKEKSSA